LTVNGHDAITDTKITTIAWKQLIHDDAAS
jgi:hypothetical protein